MNNETILVTRSSMPELDEYVEEIKTLWDSHWLTNMGVKHETLRNLLKEYLGVENVDLLVNGHMALELSIQALNLQGEVITTPFTFASTTHAIVRNGLSPVFCDINEKNYTIDADKIENLITDKTSAIVPVHVYGNICDIDAIQNVADKYGLKVIYDAAHAFGEIYKGRGIGEYGDVSCFSFHATKVFNTIEGGAVCFSNKNIDFGKSIYQLKNFGIKNEEVVDGIGANAKMNEFAAAMGICNLRHIESEIKKRSLVFQRYVENLQNLDGIRLNIPESDVVSNYAYFPIIVDEKVFGADRNEIFDALKQHKIGARKYFYPLTNSFDCFKGMFDPQKTPVAKRISEQVLTLPMYSDLKFEDVDRICDIIKKIQNH